MKTIPYGRQYIDSQDIRLVSKALKEDLITTGCYIKKFENKISNFLKVKYVASCNSGTSALHLAFMAINLKKDDVIIMPAINFIAAYNMARLMNAKIFLADVNPLTGQMTPQTLLKCIKNNKLKRIKAIVTMYLGGYPENVIEFYNIKKKFNCYLIEDACHALGAKYQYKNKKVYVGSCSHSDISTFSLHPVKTITSGEGGVVTTNNVILANKILLLRSHGIKRDKKCHWQYDIKTPGFNYRLSDVNCALALSQILKIRKFIKFREKIYNFYKKNLIENNKVFHLPNFKSISLSSFHLFLARINFKKLKVSKDYFIKSMLKKKIMVQFHYKPIFLFKKIFHDNNTKKQQEYSGALMYYKSFVSLPIFFGLSNDKLIYIVNKIKLFINKHSK